MKSILILLATFLSSALCQQQAVSYPILRSTQVQLITSNKNTQGWSQSGNFSVIVDWEGADVRLEFVMTLQNSKANWINKGFYQQFLQLKEDLKSNGTNINYSNYVCSMRLTSLNQYSNFTTNDLYESNSCGNVSLSTIQNTRYNTVIDQLCHNIWYNNNDITNFHSCNPANQNCTDPNRKTATCAVWRYLKSETIDSSTLKFGDTVSFKTGFNIYLNMNDGAPDVTGKSEMLTFLVLDGAFQLAGAFSLIVLILIN